MLLFSKKDLKSGSRIIVERSSIVLLCFDLSDFSSAYTIRMWNHLIEKESLSEESMNRIFVKYNSVYVSGSKISQISVILWSALA